MPVVNNVPPVEAEYHFTVVPFVPGDAVRVTVPAPLREPLYAVGEEGVAIIVAVTGTLGAALSQPVDELYEVK